MKLLRDIVQKRKAQVYFTHLNHSNLALDPDGDARKTMKKETFDLAEEGMEFSL
jgi:pyrroloquinoline quinone biosynthesis protein B